jgi:4-hydroxybenzoate polyprenyltransferase
LPEQKVAPNVEPSATLPSILKAHFQIARVDHWFKNVFVLPGMVVAFGMSPEYVAADAGRRMVAGLLAVCVIASSNYVINEVMDARQDRFHPAKNQRPVAEGRVLVPLAYAQWLALLAAGLGLAVWVSRPLAATLGALWLMGCIYNIPPVRSKDVAYLDVLSESVNNPLRLLAGWYIAGAPATPPASLLLSYWMVGAYFMGMKRFAEYRWIGDKARAALYRKSFAFYDEKRLLVSIMFYGASAMLFFGAFIMRYRIEWILSFPLVAWVMASYLSLALRDDSPVQYPEKLYRQRKLMAAVAVCALVMTLLLFVDIPALHRIFAPTLPGR